MPAEHAYTPFYYEILKDKRVKKVMELGLGYFDGIQDNDRGYDRRLGRWMQKGGSLKMWRDFFPNAQVYGLDVKPETLVNEERIVSFLCDERNTQDWDSVLEQTGTDIDLFIDDGIHNMRHQISVCRYVLPKLQRSVIYIIEDVKQPERLAEELSDFNCYVPVLGNARSDEGLVVVAMP